MSKDCCIILFVVGGVSMTELRAVKQAAQSLKVVRYRV